MDHGIPLAILAVIGVLIPRIARWVIRKMTIRMNNDAQDSKGHRAILGAVVYVLEAVAYFILIVNVMKHFGFTLAGAAIPATVISAAIGFGAQKFIGDFLGGFFIITEQQYGIGDWVQFNTKAGQVEGDVIRVTMRATTIRTLSGEEIIIPNGETSFNVNFSSAWSRAVVLTTLPLSAADSIDELIDRTTKAAHRALERDDVKASLISELKVQPFSKVIVPEVAGVPWQAVIRMIVDVQPGEQWHVEREIRKEVAREWWHELTAVATDDIAVAIRESGFIAEGNGQASSAEANANHGDHHNVARTEAQRAPRGGISDSSGGNEADTDRAKKSEPATTKLSSVTGKPVPLALDDDGKPLPITAPHFYAPHLLPTVSQLAKESRDRRAQQELAKQRARERREQDNPTEEIFLGNENARSDVPRAAAAREMRDESEKKQNKLLQEESKRKDSATSWRRIVTLGGRMRTSTALLFLGLFALIGLSVMAIDPGADNGNKGWLAPPRETTQPEIPTPTPTPTQTTTPTQTWQEPTTTQQQTEPTQTEQYPPEQNPDGTAPAPGGTSPSPRQPGQTGTSTTQNPTPPSTSQQAPAPTTSQRQGLIEPQPNP